MLGLILVVVGVLGLLTIISLTMPVSIIIIVAGLLAVVFGSGRVNWR